MGEAEIGAFHSHLAVKEKVSASTQNQALNAVAFMYRVFVIEILWTSDIKRHSLYRKCMKSWFTFSQMPKVVLFEDVVEEV